MDIANLLAQGTRARPAGMEQNALMQGQEMRQRQMQNALMQMNMQAAIEQRAQAQQAAEQQAQWRNALQVPQGEQFLQPGRPAMNAAQAESAVGTPGYGMSSAQDQMRTMPADPRMVQAVQMAKAGLMSPMDLFKIQNPERKTASAAAGSMIYDERTGQMIAQVPDKAKQDEFVARMVAAGIDPASPQGRAMLMDKLRKDSTHQPPVSVSYGAPVSGIDDKGNPVFFQPAKAGGTPAIIPGVRPKSDDEKPLTDAQSKALLFASRMLSADKTLGELSRKGTQVSVPGSTNNGAIGSAVNMALPAEQQQLAQAKRDFVNAVLRRESGAVISPDEFSNADKQYFPQPGDSRQVIEQKARNRRVAIEGMRTEVPKARQSEVDRVSNSGQTPEAAQPGAPKAGDVVDGYRFKGGNPADKANWERE